MSIRARAGDTDHAGLTPLPHDPPHIHPLYPSNTPRNILSTSRRLSGRPVAATLSVAIAVAAIAVSTQTHIVTSNSTVATGPSWHMTHKAWNAQIYARVGNRRRGTRKLAQQQHVNDTRIGFLNARGMGDRTFRQYLLAQYRRRFHILALAETWCPGRNEEREWAKDWKKSGGWSGLRGHQQLQTTNTVLKGGASGSFSRIALEKWRSNARK